MWIDCGPFAEYIVVADLTETNKSDKIQEK